MASTSIFRDRCHAGRVLAQRLKELSFDSPTVVALPRGGVPAGFEVAGEWDAPLEIAVRKLGASRQPELGVGAVGENGTVVLDRGAVQATALDQEEGTERSPDDS